ncbi:MAG: DUF3078 domain-containing protein [Bacteroides sp.]|nr:DUF3078 domain-containing protein [Bacteroides sp.]
MKKFKLTLGMLLMAALTFAQEPAPVDGDTLWKFTGVTSLSMSQLSLTNWAAGGENAISGNVFVKLSPDYDNGTINWDNDLILGFGLMKQGDNEADKSDDQIELTSKFGYRAGKNWFYTALLSFKSQFANGYSYADDVKTKISSFLAPGYLNLSLGFDYKPTEGFSLLLAPISTKMTFINDQTLADAGVYAPAGESFRGEFGGYIKIAYKKEILKNVLLDTQVDFFSNYVDNPQYVDVNWDLLITFKVNEFISASLMTQLIYDYDIKFGPAPGQPKVQFKELFGLGLAYNF